MNGGKDGGGDGRLTLFRKIDQTLRMIRTRFLNIGEGIKTIERKKTRMNLMVED